MPIRAIHTRDSENIPFPGPLQVPDEKSFLNIIPEAEGEELDAQLLDYTNINCSNPFADPDPFIHDRPEVRRVATGRRHRRRSSKRILPPRFKAPPVTPTFTDSWYNRYSTQTYINELVAEILGEAAEVAPMDVDPPAHTRPTPRAPPGINSGKDYYAGAVAKMLLNRSDVKRKRTWSWQYRPSRLGCELTLL